MAVIETWLDQDLQKPVKVRYIDGNLFSHNGNGNRIGVVVTNNGEAVTLTGTVSGYAVLADGTTVPCTGTRSGNRASILIPPAAYLPGAIFISVFLTDGTTVTTLAAIASTVMQTRTNTQVDPGSVVTDWTQTINAVMQSVVDANAANMATPYEDLPYPVPLGKYTLYNNLLYRCISPIASSESWTAAHWTRVKIADEVSDLKKATTQLRPFETQAQFVWIDGKYINTHGNESGNANHKCTSFIALNPNSKYTTNLSVFWALYDEAKTYIPGSWQSAVVDLTTDNSIRYIRFSIEKSAETEPVVLSHTNNVVDELQTDVNEIKTELEANRHRIAVLSGITYTVGKIISNTDGEVYDNAGYSANTDYIELPFKSGKFTFPVTEKHGVVSLAFYDSNKVFISAYQQEGNEFDYIEVNIPSNAVYFRNTLANEDVQNQPYYDCVFINDETFSALFDDTQKNIKDVEFSKVILNMAYRSGHLVLYTNGEDYSGTTSSANYSATDFIKLPPIRDKLFFPLLSGMSGNGGLAFYDTEQKFITGYKGTADMRSVVLTEITIPDNAVYFKNCIYTSLLPNYEVCNNIYFSTAQIANLVTWDMREKFFKDRFVLHVGTSISDSRNGIPCTWFAQAMKMVGCENYQNSARSGKGPQYHAENYNTLIAPYITGAYLFTIEHGQNNATTNLGTVDNMIPDSQGNYDITTWYGAMAYIITRARSENMFVKIALIGSWHTGIFPHQQNVANFFNLPLLDMCKMIGCSNQEVTTTITLSNGETLSGTKTIRNWFATYINANGDLVEGETESPDGGIHPYNPDAQKKYATCYANYITSI